jgi:hypothetical protein
MSHTSAAVRRTLKAIRGVWGVEHMAELVDAALVHELYPDAAERRLAIARAVARLPKVLAEAGRLPDIMGERTVGGYAVTGWSIYTTRLYSGTRGEPDVLERRLYLPQPATVHHGSGSVEMQPQLGVLSRHVWTGEHSEPRDMPLTDGHIRQWDERVSDPYGRPIGEADAAHFCNSAAVLANLVNGLGESAVALGLPEELLAPALPVAA